MDYWFQLDNAAKIYPSIISKKSPNFFRLSVYLKETIHYDFLLKALKKALNRFSYFQVLLKRGFFWYYFEKTEKLPLIVPEKPFPSIPVKITPNFVPFKVIPYNRRITVEFTHILTDGFGALNFLQALTAEYIGIKYGYDDQIKNFLNYYDNLFDEEQFIFENYLNKINKNKNNKLNSIKKQNLNFLDPFLKFKDKTIKKPEKLNKAYKLPLKPIKSSFYIITKCRISIDKLKEVINKLRKKLNLKITINDYLVSTTLFTLQTLYLELKKNNKKILPIRVVVPVDLRKFFNEKSLKNFSFIVHADIYPSLGYYSFEEILKRTYHQIRLKATKKEFLPPLTRNIKAQQNIFIRLIPLFIKDFILKIAYSTIGALPFTTSLSNLGLVKIPESIARWIKEFEFIPAPANDMKVNLGVIGFKDYLTISIGRKTKYPFFEKIFIKKLVNDGITPEIFSNIRFEDIKNIK